MKISLSKSVVLVQGVSDPVTITINDVALKVVEKFCYLGSNVTASGSLVSELDARIGKAASTFGKLSSRVWANQHLSIHVHVKIRVYGACVLSKLVYGCEIFSFALMFTNGWFTACDDFYDASACWLSHII